MLLPDFHRLFFREAVPLIRIGRKRALQPEDAPALPDRFAPSSASPEFEHLDTSQFGPFIRKTFFAAGRPAKRVLTLTVIKTLITLSSPILLKLMLERLPQASVGEQLPVMLLLLAVMLGMSGMVGALFMQHFYYNALNVFAMVVNGLNRRVVDHALRLRHSARSTMNTGDLVNHLSSDSDAIAECGFFFPEFFNTALQTTLVLVVLTYYLGWASLAALATLMVISPLTVMVAKRYRRLDHHLMELRDERVTLMSQILQGIRVVKYQAWEPSVHAEVAAVRRQEIGTRVKIVATDAMSTVLFISTTTIVAFAGFGTYVLLGGELTAPLIFACIALFGMLEEPFGLVSHLLANLQHARVATQRLHSYFTAATRQEDHREMSAPNHPVGLTAFDLVMQYQGAEQNALDHITLSIRPGSSVAIVGAVGSGKSTLLRTLAGLHQLSAGTLDTTNIYREQRPRTAYVPQEAFIMNASIEENILFGQPSFNETNAMSDILHACALDQDLALMPAGLATEIGERGVNLSGGQKQRVSLARAVAQSPGIVFLDDPLSAVDVHTEDHLVDRLLFGRWSSITRVVVTHRLTHLSRFDHIIVLDHGRIVAQGIYDEIKHAIPAEALLHVAETPRIASPLPEKAGHTHAIDDQEVHRGDGRITDDEDRDIGAVRMDVYFGYVRAMIGAHPVRSWLILIALIGTAAAITVLPMMQTWWLGYWSDHRDVLAYSPLAAVAIYGVLGTVVLTGWLGERFLWLYRSAAAGRKIHDDALEGVLAAPLRFFDSTPMGRVLNRFARDMEGVDDHLSWNFEQSFKSLSQTIGSLILILSVLPLVAVVMVPVLWIYYRLQRDYRSAAREAKRIESVMRSPRYAHFKEMVTGLDVIHGYGRERYFVDTYHTILTAYQRAFYCSILLNRWFSIRVPLVSGLVGIATSVGIVVLAHQGAISTGLAGVVLTYALSFWMSLNWAIRAFSEVESRMTSVERLRTYGSLSPEPTTIRTPVLPDSASWPVNGAVEFRELCVRYAPHLPRVLHNVTFTVPARAKVGIIGRTGSGKSTLFQTLFRMVEAESGAILIDGVDIATVPLPRLRRSLAIIPQDPTLFIGTIRSNLDRFNEATDEQVWTALRRVRLESFVRSLPKGLNAEVVEGGLNFSQGQRQLLCMARAILADARIIVLDEATASVDLETDALIQQTIRDEFADVTVLIIAHRLDTVADADMIVELSEGRVVRINRASSSR